mmetsp:Transcript_23682/g.49348  ORF Transcript_23682/g.49348 Transcript_23682/m.49348 type:complete len:89 (-) Transcript_23682:6-272(-)
MIAMRPMMDIFPTNMDDGRILDIDICIYSYIAENAFICPTVRYTMIDRSAGSTVVACLKEPDTNSLYLDGWLRVNYFDTTESKWRLIC